MTSGNSNRGCESARFLPEKELTSKLDLLKRVPEKKIVGKVEENQKKL